MGFYADSDLLQMQDIVTYDAPNAQGRGGARHLSAVLPAVSAALGAPVSTRVHADAAGLQTALGIPSARSVLVVLVDGLGFWNVVERKGHAPFLRSLLSDSANSRPISSSFPTTTATALSVFGTGTCPGLTGMTGYSQINPATRELSQMIKFTGGLDPLAVQTQPTVFEQLANAGVRVTTAGLYQFKNSALTQAALRGPKYISGPNAEANALAAAKATHTPGLTYLYIRDADKMGHQYGWRDEHWVSAFETVDEQLRTVVSRAARGTLLIITADHGMISSNPDTRIDIAEHAELREGVDVVGGEPRAVALYAREGASTDEVNALAERWRDFLGSRALVYTKDEAIRAGLYGPGELMREDVRAYLGDILVLATGDVTIVDSRVQTDMATRLPSVHGSLTKAEVDIPLFMDVL
ncbi:alkaline phosphatase family protein [Alloscardovia macacae]|nr:alkaline phosphatase family protein [Alloscardovia macacae]